MNVMIVDDEPLARDRLRALLTEEFDDINVVAEAGDGVQALAEAGKHTPDLVFLDVRMPGMDGGAPFSAIRASASGGVHHRL